MEKTIEYGDCQSRHHRKRANTGQDPMMSQRASTTLALTFDDQMGSTTSALAIDAGEAHA